MNKRELIENLLKSNLIRIGEIINYQRFKEIHSNGYSHIPEYHFAEMLGINNGNFNNVKNKGQSTPILKELIPAEHERLANEIAENLLGSQKIEAGQRITYEMFLEFYKPYSYLSEITFGSFLELNDDSLYRLRKGKTSAVYSSRFNSEKILQQLIAEGLVSPGDKINYEQFLQHYTSAIQAHPSLSHFSQYAFAKLLEIRKSTFTKFKTSDSMKLQILKSRAPQKKKYSAIISDEARMAIVNDLINSNGATPYEFLDYERFQELHKGYRQYSEYNFALILDMSKSSFCSLKKGKRARILKDCFDKEQILNDLLNSDQLKIGESIDYKKFCELYQNFEYLGVFIFADILEISEGALERLKADETAACVTLRSRIKTVESPKTFYSDIKKQAQAYVEELFATGKVHIGQEIDYSEFKEFYSHCNYISEYDFASLLGISYFKCRNMKVAGTKTYIHDYKVIEAINLIGNIEKQKFYSKNEIDTICQQYQITPEDFIRYFIYKGNLQADIKSYMDSLNIHSGLYVGRTRMSNEFFEKMQNSFQLPIYRLVGSMSKKYRCLRYLEDYKSEALLYILEKCGDIEKNFYDCENQELITAMLLSRTRFFLLDKMVGSLKIDLSEKSTSSFYTRRDNPTFYIPDKNTNVEETVVTASIDETLEAQIMR